MAVFELSWAINQIRNERNYGLEGGGNAGKNALEALEEWGKGGNTDEDGDGPVLPSY